MPEFVLQLWAAMVVNSAMPFTTTALLVPTEHRQAVWDRVAAMHRRFALQERARRVREIQAERGVA